LRWVEPLDLLDLDVPGDQVDHGNQYVDEGDLEAPAVPLDHQTVLCGTVFHCGHHPTPWPYFQAHQVGRPVFAFSKSPSLPGKDFSTPQLLGLLPCGHALEGHLGAFLAASHLADGEVQVAYEHTRADLEIVEVLGLDIEAEKAVEPVRPPQPCDGYGPISRGIRLQR
jgi:hypothetical protein